MSLWLQCIKTFDLSHLDGSLSITDYCTVLFSWPQFTQETLLNIIPF